MSDKKPVTNYAYTLLRNKGEYYLFARELGIIVHDKDLNTAFEQLSSEKDKLLNKLDEAGLPYPEPSRSVTGKNLISTVTAGVLALALVMMLIFGLTTFMTPSHASADNIVMRMKPLFDDILGQTGESLLRIEKSTEEMAKRARLSSNLNYWSPEKGGNGHYYKVIEVENGVTWDEAVVSSQKLGGTLATISSVAESDFIYRLVDGEDRYWSKHGPYSLGPWIGGSRSPDKDTGWVWVDGEPITFDNWADGHPSSDKSDENNRINLFQGNKWISNSGNYKLQAYIAEFAG